MSEKKKEILALALGIALLPPLWAVAAPYIGIKTGGGALICAGLYAANGNKRKDGLKIMAGFWCGDLWAVAALWFIGSLPFNGNMNLFLTLAVLGAMAVVISSILEKIIFLPSWLCGWAIGLTLLTPDQLMTEKSLPIQIAAAMAVGVWYVGVGVDMFQKCLISKIRNGDK